MIRFLLVGVLLALVLATQAWGQVGLKVQIMGEITDRDERGIAVWGVAIPVNGNPVAYGALVQESNIVVLGAVPTHPVIYQGIACFQGKATGENAYGASVPMWVYGPCQEKR